MDGEAFLRFVLDPVRLAIVGATAAGTRSVDEVVTTVGAGRRKVLEALGTLVAEGVCEVHEGGFRLRPEALREMARDLPGPPPPHPRLRHGMTDDEWTVLSRFFAGSRLVRLPTQRRKRRVVLERLALEFEPGRRYEERAVDRVLRGFHDDHATLRRALVDEGLLDRAAGWYWRAGGRVVLRDGSSA